VARFTNRNDTPLVDRPDSWRTKRDKPPGVSLQAPTARRPGGNFDVARDEVFSIHDGNPKPQIPSPES